VHGLLAALDASRPQLHAIGWQALRDDLEATAQTAEFRALAAELPALREQIERCSSVTLGVNLDAQLRPESATLLSVNAGRFGGPQGLLGRLLGGRAGQAGISPLRQAGERQAFGPDRQLFLDLSQLIEEVTAPIAESLTRYARLSGAPLAALEGELAFYLGAARLIRSLRAESYVLTRPTIAPPDARVFQAQALYNLELALRLRGRPTAAGAPAAPVANDSSFDEAGRIFILTGPNRGGKTTFTRAVGLAIVMAQAGLPVPAAGAQISPADAIFTLFPAAEQVQTGMGRLDEEAGRLASIFRRATDRSLVLINEPLGSTSPREAIEIARDLVCGLRILGVRGILVTHLHDLAYAAETLNEAVEGPSRVATLVAGAEGDPAGGADHADRTYRISAGLPDGRSYAADIAVAHGLHLDQIRRTLHERGV
jgi:dsDNA-specific endonuclease/ATPase MutS2